MIIVGCMLFVGMYICLFNRLFVCSFVYLFFVVVAAAFPAAVGVVCCWCQMERGSSLRTCLPSTD